jgi:hypothetical protein
VHSLYRSSTRGPEDDSVQSKRVAPLSHVFNCTAVVFDGTSPPPPYVNTFNFLAVQNIYPESKRSFHTKLYVKTIYISWDFMTLF